LPSAGGIVLVPASAITLNAPIQIAYADSVIEIRGGGSESGGLWENKGTVLSTGASFPGASRVFEIAGNASGRATSVRISNMAIRNDHAAAVFYLSAVRNIILDHVSVLKSTGYSMHIVPNEHGWCDFISVKDSVFAATDGALHVLATYDNTNDASMTDISFDKTTFVGGSSTAGWQIQFDLIEGLYFDKCYFEPGGNRKALNIGSVANDHSRATKIVTIRNSLAETVGTFLYLDAAGYAIECVKVDGLRASPGNSGDPLIETGTGAGVKGLSLEHIRVATDKLLELNDAEDIAYIGPINLPSGVGLDARLTINAGRVVKTGHALYPDHPDIFIPASAFYITGGTPSRGILGPQVYQSFSTWDFDQSAPEFVAAIFTAPTGGKLQVKFQYAMPSVTAGVVRCLLNYCVVAAGGDCNGAGTDCIVNSTVPGTAKTRESVTMTTTLAVNADDLVRLCAGRDAGNAADTAAEDAQFLGLTLRYL